jgi:PAS domain S-box-containing protein
MAGLTAALAHPSSNALQALADTIVAMGIAGSAGVSLAISTENGPQCLWRAVSGQWSRYVGKSVQLDLTPCSFVIMRNTALLFENPSRYFTEPKVEPGIHEILMVPLRSDGVAIGAIWGVSHDDRHRFEQEDLRLLERLSALASVAFRLDEELERAQEERGGALEDLARTKESLRQMVEGVPLLLWRASNEGNWTWASPQWTGLTGQSCKASLGQGWLNPVHPADRERARRAWRRAGGAQAFQVEYRIYDLAADRYRWFQTRASPVYDSTGAIVEWLGSSADVDDLETLREHERALLAELQHRGRNTLAMVRSIARRTLARSDTLEEFQMNFEGRLDAFARSQALVARDPNAGVDLATLVADELLAHHARESDRVVIAGPAVRLPGKVADTLGLAIHELVVNAVKYGGLSDDLGRVDVNWRIEQGADCPALAFSWFDTRPGLVVDVVEVHGFGRELIERILVYDLDAETSLTIGADGARCDIRLPLRNIAQSN